MLCTARNSSKMKQLASSSPGIETLELDVCSDDSIALMDVNCWAYLSMMQACLPLLLKSSRPMIINNTSLSSVTGMPFQSAYSASKAAVAMFSNAMRLELQAFGITVVEWKTGIVKSNLIRNISETKSTILPKGSMYEPAKDIVEKVLRQDEFTNAGMAQEEWAKLTVQDVLKKNPPSFIWRGDSALLVRIMSILPTKMFDGPVKKMFGLDVVEKIVLKQKQE